MCSKIIIEHRDCEQICVKETIHLTHFALQNLQGHQDKGFRVRTAMLIERLGEAIKRKQNRRTRLFSRCPVSNHIGSLVIRLIQHWFVIPFRHGRAPWAAASGLSQPSMLNPHPPCLWLFEDVFHSLFYKGHTRTTYMTSARREGVEDEA